MKRKFTLPKLTCALLPDPTLGFDLWLTMLVCSKREAIQINCLCYNAAHMQNDLRFANNNNDNDDPRIVGRSLAG